MNKAYKAVLLWFLQQVDIDRDEAETFLTGLSKQEADNAQGLLAHPV